MKIAIIAVITVITLAACGGTNENGTAVSEANVPFVSSFYVDAIDGQRVVCIWAGLGYGGGLSCDWEQLIVDRETDRYVIRCNNFVTASAYAAAQDWSLHEWSWFPAYTINNGVQVFERMRNERV